MFNHLIRKEDIMKLATRNTDNKKMMDTQMFPSPFSGLFDGIFNEGLSREVLNKVPAVNIMESDNNYVLELSAPGYSKDEIKIELENDVLSISGEHKTSNEEKEGNTYTRREFGYGAFKRSFSLPETVNTDKIEAKYDNGILKLTLTKKEEAKPKPPKSIKIS